MSLAVVGVSHQTAPVEVRERFAYLEQDVPAALEALRRASGVEEAVLLSTCNRTELYFYPTLGPETVELAERMLAEKAGSLSRPVASYLYRHRDLEAVRHLFRVASGLDSLVMGESEIQGQVRDAYQIASGGEASPAHAGPVLNRLFQTALSVGGRVRSETPIGEGAASVASVAVELAKKIFGDLNGRRVMVLGAGSTAELVVEALGREGAHDVTVVNRTYERASDLAQRFKGRAVGLQELSGALRDADIVITSTAAPHAVLRMVTFSEAFPHGRSRPLLIVDIAIPRDVEPAMGDEANVFLYNIDDLRKLIDDTLERRQEAVAAADRIVLGAAHEFLSWFAGLEVVPVIRALREQADVVREAELARLLSRPGLTDADREAIADFSQRLLNKLLHGPTVRLREGAANGRAAELVDLVRFLYGLDEPRGGSGNHKP
jgi:glutamyl-tRNA reductase